MEQVTFQDLMVDVKERIVKRIDDDGELNIESLLDDTIHEELDTHIERLWVSDVSLYLQDYGFGKAIQTYSETFALMDLEGKSPYAVEKLLLYVCVKDTLEGTDWTEEFKVWNQ